MTEDTLLGIEYVRDPRWIDVADRTRFDCIVKFEKLKVEVPFTASREDVVPHGREIFRRGVEGGFGEIQPALPREPARESGRREAPPIDSTAGPSGPILSPSNRS